MHYSFGNLNLTNIYQNDPISTVIYPKVNPYFKFYEKSYSQVVGPVIHSLWRAVCAATILFDLNLRLIRLSKTS